jgi:hypothetical protein
VLVIDRPTQGVLRFRACQELCVIDAWESGPDAGVIDRDDLSNGLQPRNDWLDRGLQLGVRDEDLRA